MRPKAKKKKSAVILVVPPKPRRLLKCQYPNCKQYFTRLDSRYRHVRK